MTTRIEDALGRLRASEQEMEFSRVRHRLCDIQKLIIDLPEEMTKELDKTRMIQKMATTQLKSFRKQLIAYPGVQQQPPHPMDNDVHRLVTHDLAIVRHVIRLENPRRKYQVDTETGIVRRRHREEPVPVYNVENLQRRLHVIESALVDYDHFIWSVDR